MADSGAFYSEHDPFAAAANVGERGCGAGPAGVRNREDDVTDLPTLEADPLGDLLAVGADEALFLAVSGADMPAMGREVARRCNEYPALVAERDRLAAAAVKAASILATLAAHHRIAGHVGSASGLEEVARMLAPPAPTAVTPLAATVLVERAAGDEMGALTAGQMRRVYDER